MIYNPPTKTNPITAWSFSRLSDYRKCPRKFKYKYVDKLPEPPSPAMERGSAIHKVLQDYVEARRGAKIPKELAATMKPELLELYARLRKAKAKCELEYAVDKSWVPTGWFDPSTWTRAKLDIELHLPKENAAEVVDTKTGKERPAEHAEQLETYAVIEWAHRPLLDEIRAAMAYVDQGKLTWAVFTDREATVKRLRRKWEAAAKPLLADRAYRATPSKECSWCPFSERRGGPCDKG